MTFKRNIITILYTILFLVITGFGFFQMTNLAVATTTNKYLVAGILVFGLIVYLLLAFFVKEADFFRVIQNKSVLLIIFELLLVLACNGLTFYINWMQRGMFCAATITLLLVCLYAAARLCGGRLCGFLSLVSGFYLLLKIASTDMVQIEATVDVLCFLIPFIIFLAVQHILIPAVGENGFLVIASYLVLGFLFSMAIALNPLVFVLLAGCVFSLLFASPKKESCSKLGKGVFCAAYLVLFTAVLLFCIHLIVPDIFQLSIFKPDHGLPMELSRGTFDYVIAKYTRPIIYLYLPFGYGIFPTVMLFFAILAGYYTIRNKSSYMGPAILSFVAMFAFYIFFCEGGSQFYYLTYLLPLFAAYGFSNTLIADEKSDDASEKVVLDEIPSEKEEESIKIIEEEENSNLESTEQTVVEKDEIKNEAPKETIKVRVPPVPVNNEIPEWTIPEEFLSEKQEEYLLPEEEIVSEENPSDIEENITTSEDSEEDALDLDQFVPESTEDNMNQLTDEPDVPKQDEDMDQLDILPEQDVTRDNDVEQFVTEAALDNTDSMIDLSSEETQLHNLLDRLDMSEPIKRMNESAQEDIADVIEREEEQVELSEALPLKPSKSTLPKYKKPDFDFEIEPVNIPLDDQYSNISEYDEVPTIHDLENQWKSDSMPIIETVATKVEEDEAVEQPSAEPLNEPLDEPLEKNMENHPIHSEEIVRKNGIGKRSYHKITIR